VDLAIASSVWNVEAGVGGGQDADVGGKRGEEGGGEVDCMHVCMRWLEARRSGGEDNILKHQRKRKKYENI